MKVFREYTQFENFPIKYFEVKLQERLYPYINWHESVEIIHINEGNTTFKLDDKQIKCTSGDVMVIWSNQFHSSYSEEYTDYQAVEVDIVQFLRIFRLNNLHKYYRNLSFSDKIKNKEIAKLIIDIIKLAKKCDEESVILATEYFYKFLHLLKSKPEMFPLKQKEQAEDKNENVELDVFDYIRSNYEKNITLESAAQYIGYTPAHLLRIFKKITNNTFKNYLNEFRIDKSLYYLSMGYSVKEAAYKSGFNDVNTYIRNFKKFKNCKPSEYIDNEVW